jgi:hypothetical protein
VSRRGAGASDALERVTVVAAGFLGGLTVGLVVWSRQIREARRHLFSARPLRRLAALSYLGSRPSVETARLLRDYVAWERRPALRRRGERLLRRLEASLE